MKTQTLFALQSKKSDHFFVRRTPAYLDHHIFVDTCPPDELTHNNLPEFFSGDEMFHGVRAESEPWILLADHTPDDVRIVEFSVRVRTIWDVEQTYTKEEWKRAEED